MDTLISFDSQSCLQCCWQARRGFPAQGAEARWPQRGCEQPWPLRCTHVRTGGLRIWAVALT